MMEAIRIIGELVVLVAAIYFAHDVGKRAGMRTGAEIACKHYKGRLRDKEAPYKREPRNEQSG